jgi:paraquat-inducible protein B
VILAIIAILLLAGGEWLQQRQQHILYFNETGQGLQVGAPVVFLGVRVGTVKVIQISAGKEQQQFKMRVTIDLDLQMINPANGKKIAPQDQLTTRQLIDQGLRARLKMQSLLTGQLYVDLGFYPGKPAVFVNGAADKNEIPTIPMTVQELTTMLEDFPMNQFLADLASLASSTSKLLSSAAVNSIPGRLDSTLAHLESLTAKFDAREEPLLQEAESVLAEISQAIDAVRSATDLIGSAADQVAKLSEADSPLSQPIRQAGDELAKAAKVVQLLADEDSPTVQQLNTSLQEISRAACSLHQLADSLEQQPEAILRGKRTVEENP